MDPNSSILTILSTLGIVGGGGSIVGWIVVTSVKRRLEDLEKIPNLEQRVINLEHLSATHNETKEAVVRMEEQIKGLTEQVRSLSELLMRKVFK